MAVTPSGRGRARLGEEIRRAAGDAGAGVRLEQATVTAVQTGAAADGNDLVTVAWRGLDVPAPYPAGLALSVGQVVLVAYQDPQLLILSRLIGTP